MSLSMVGAGICEGEDVGLERDSVQLVIEDHAVDTVAAVVARRSNASADKRETVGNGGPLLHSRFRVCAPGQGAVHQQPAGGEVVGH